MARKKKPSSPLKAYLKYSSLGFEMVGAILLGAALGYWLEGLLDVRRPFLLLPGLLLGLGAAMYSLFKRLQNDDFFGAGGAGDRKKPPAKAEGSKESPPKPLSEDESGDDWQDWDEFKESGPR